MGNSPTQRRFKINPAEFAIFSVISVIFLNSVYHLFYDQQGFHPSTVVNVNLPAEPARTPASLAQAAAPSTPVLMNYEVRCEENVDQSTQADKLRLTGSVCAPQGGRQPASVGSDLPLNQVTVTNLANKFSATVFSDQAGGKYSTDYIPLNAGRNPIEVLFTYAGGQTSTQSFVVEKAEK